MATKNTTNKILTALPGVLLIALVAGVLTYGGQKVVAEATKPKPAVVKTVTVTQAEDTTEATTPNTTTPSTTSPTTPATQTTATTNSFVNLRPTASTSGTTLEGLEEGTKVQYETKTTGQWQQVTVNGKSGYVFARYLDY